MNLLIWQVTVLACFVELAVCGVTKSSIVNIVAGDKGGNVKEKFGACPGKNSKFPVYLSDPDDCSRFFICDNGVPHLKKCLPGLHFNPTIDACDFPKNAKCETDAGEKGKGRNVKEKYDACPEKNSKFPVYLPDPHDCSQFYICDNGIPYLKKCLPGLHFNPTINACDHAKNAKCETNDETKGKITHDDLRTCPAENSKFPVYLPHPDDCNRFYICDNGSPILKVCHPGLYFNTKINACDFPANAGCEEKRKSKIRRNAPGMCRDENSEFPEFFPHSEDCNQFYVCHEGWPTPIKCPTGLHFNPKLNICDFPANAGCDTGMSMILRGKSFNDHSFMPCPDEDSPDRPTLYAHPTDCDKFYECDQGIALLKSCEPGLNFNDKTKACDPAENAVCENEMTLASAGVQSPFCPSRDGKIPVFYRHPTNCNVYYMCGNGLAYEFVCPARLHFNLRKKVCDYEVNAKCRT